MAQSRDPEIVASRILPIAEPRGTLNLIVYSHRRTAEKSYGVVDQRRYTLSSQIGYWAFHNRDIIWCVLPYQLSTINAYYLSAVRVFPSEAKVC